MTTATRQMIGESTSVRSFPRLAVPEAELADLRERIKATRWPTRELVTDDSQGVQLATIQALASYWADGYDWRKIEARLNAPPQFLRDGVLDNITMYWLTKTAISSARLYWENKLGFFNVQGVTVPTGVSAFPYELYQAPQSWAEEAYPKLVYYKKHDVGGHFVAWERPQLFSEDVRATFRTVRKGA